MEEEKETTEQNLKRKAYEVLLAMGFNINHIGTRYLVEAILIIHDSKNFDIIKSVEKNVYVEVANNHHKNPMTVKSDITKATKYADDGNFIKNKKEYYLHEKLTSKAAISKALLELGV